MLHLLLIGAFLFFAFIAPVKTTVTLVALVVLVSLAAKAAAEAISQAPVTFSQALRSVGFSLFFVAVGLFTVGSLSVSTGITQFTGAAGLAVLAALLFVYVLGFKIGMGITLAASAGVAVVATVVSGALLWMASKVAS